MDCRIGAWALAAGVCLGAASVFAGYGKGFQTRFDLDGKGSHVQGICATTNAVYFSQDRFLYSCDWEGRLLKKVAAVDHTGDLCWHGDRLYASICLRKPLPGGEKGLVIVYDKDLNEIRRSRPFPRPADGIERIGDMLYVGLGSDAPQPAKPHRKNFLVKFDAESLEMLGELKSYDYGFETCYGVQDIATDGANLLLMFYGQGTNTVLTDRDYRLIRPIPGFAANNGLALLNGAGATKERRFLRATTHVLSRSGGCNDRRMLVSFDVVVFDGERFTVEK